MNKKIARSLLVIPILLLGFSGCDKINSSEESNYFYSSFESAADTLGWQGLSKSMFVNDPAPQGGKSSLHIGGGCPQPAAVYELPAVPEGKYRLSFWGKMGQPSQSAQVYLYYGDREVQTQKIELQVSGEEWKSYVSTADLNVPANTKLKLEIWVGGIILADVYIDMLKVEKVN